MSNYSIKRKKLYLILNLALGTFRKYSTYCPNANYVTFLLLFIMNSGKGKSWMVSRWDKHNSHWPERNPRGKWGKSSSFFRYSFIGESYYHGSGIISNLSFMNMEVVLFHTCPSWTWTWKWYYFLLTCRSDA